jgi:hypothetical protein
VPRWARFNVTGIKKLITSLKCNDKAQETVHVKIERAFCRIILLELAAGSPHYENNPMLFRQRECIELMFNFVVCTK